MRLRAVTLNDTDLLYDWFTDPSVAKVWRYRGRTPDLDSFTAHLWSGVLAHFMCFSDTSDNPAGYVALYDPSFPAKNVKLSVLVAPELRMGAIGVKCALAAMDFAFQQWPLDRIFMECNSYSIAQFQSALDRGLLTEEARIVNFECFGRDQWADLIYVSTSRDIFDKFTGQQQSVHPPT